MEKEGTSLLPDVIVYGEKKRKRGLFAEMRERLRARTRADVLGDLLFLVVAFLFARTHALFGVYPFAIALICALRHHLAAASLGAVAGCLIRSSTVGPLYLAFTLLALLLRLVISRLAPRLFESEGLFDEHPLYRVLEACLVGCVMAAYELAFFGIYDYTVLFALGAVLLLPLLTLLYAALFETGVTLGGILGRTSFRLSRETRTGSSALYLQIGGVSLLFSVVLALSPYSFYGISLSRCFAALCVLLIARRFGGVRGAVAGMLLSIAHGVSAVGSLGLLGLLSGLYGVLGVPCALAAAVLASGAFAAYTGGLSELLATVPETTVSALLLWPFLRSIEPVEDTFFVPEEKREREKEKERGMGIDGTVADTYKQISSVLSRLAEAQRTVDEEEKRAICRRARSTVCKRCHLLGSCKEEEAVLDALVGEGKEEALSCRALSEMREAVKGQRARLLARGRQGGIKGAFSAEYALHARLLEECARQRCEEDEEDETLSASLKEHLEKNGVRLRAATVLGRRTRRVLLEGVRTAGVTADRLVLLASQICGGLSLSSVTDKGRRFLLVAEERYALKYAVSSSACAEGEASGDRAAQFFDGRGMAYAALTDGMGSGRTAAIAAELCVSVLSTLLSAGVSERTALSLVSNLLCAENDECSVALDLFSLDLFGGHASFLKSGAAASYMQRADALYRIRARTIPMGVVREIDSEEVHIDVEDGDLFILLSDGVMQGNEDGVWLKELLLSSRSLPDEALAERILHTARENATGARDDMTVMLVRIEKRSSEAQTA